MEPKVATLIVEDLRGSIAPRDESKEERSLEVNVGLVGGGSLVDDRRGFVAARDESRDEGSLDVDVGFIGGVVMVVGSPITRRPTSAPFNHTDPGEHATTLSLFTGLHTIGLILDLKTFNAALHGLTLVDLT
ncbi:hypothetical protein ZIOFF_062473 [Zingiber officinale]|uniref:Uncharacterized protein n=1 Tax=Zingiber officinale TaxID=94328 RepID=A0A8J5KJ96_ZINOF|nr:hypothetical protein ZIOFF_062473 [Zingiber officinale]